MISMSAEAAWESPVKQSKIKGLEKENHMSMKESRDTAERAYLIWEQAGRPDGKALEYWLQAEAALSTEPTAQTLGSNEVAMTLKRGGRRKRGFEKNRNRR
jgi:hypothetical protein